MIKRFDFPGDKFKNRIKGSLKKALLSQEENISLLKNCARKLKIRLRGFETNCNLELYFDVYKKGRSVGYVYKGWEDPGFRIAESIELNIHTPDFKVRFYEIFKICSNRFITMGLKKEGKEFLSIVLEIGIYKSGFNAKVFKEAIEELEYGFVEIKPFLESPSN